MREHTVGERGEGGREGEREREGGEGDSTVERCVVSVTGVVSVVCMVSVITFRRLGDCGRRLRLICER